MKRVAVSQSNYIPWKGYFDQISRVDEFIFLDSVQYTRRDWRNRNQLKGPSGLIWLTIPVHSKGNYTLSIDQIQISENHWRERHLKTIFSNYSRSRQFHHVFPIIEQAYADANSSFLSEVNKTLIRRFSEYLGLNVDFKTCRQYELVAGKNDRILSICLQSQATCYLSGPAARSYLDLPLFESHGISVEFMNYGNYPEYTQSWGAFQHRVSIIDLLLNCGLDSNRFLGYL